MSTLAVVEEILRDTGAPMTVREIVERAGARLPSKSKTPDTVVARDLAMDIKRQGELSRFVRTAPGRYTLRALVAAAAPAGELAPMTGGLKHERAAALPAAKRHDAPRPDAARPAGTAG
ncbi:MAG: winged helix-turn-helix domain-containing protein [Kofleriaceae bacterium]